VGMIEKNMNYKKELDKVFGNDPVIQPVKVMSSSRKRNLPDLNEDDTVSDEETQQQTANSPES
jgi:hypothetical protein